MVSFAIKKKVHSHLRVKVKERMVSTIHKIKNTNKNFKNGLNIHSGKIVHNAVKNAIGRTSRL